MHKALITDNKVAKAIVPYYHLNIDFHNVKSIDSEIKRNIMYYFCELVNNDWD